MGQCWLGPDGGSVGIPCGPGQPGQPPLQLQLGLPADAGVLDCRHPHSVQARA